VSVDHGPDDVERLIAVEWSNLDREDGGELGKPAPEGVRKHTAADRRLQVEADEGNACGDGLAVRDEPGVVCIAERGEAEQPRVVAELNQELRFAQGLIGRPADTADADHWRGAAGVGSVHLLTRDREDRLE